VKPNGREVNAVFENKPLKLSFNSANAIDAHWPKIQVVLRCNIIKSPPNNRNTTLKYFNNNNKIFLSHSSSFSDLAAHC
jgi:hypothetical protein